MRPSPSGARMLRPAPARRPPIREPGEDEGAADLQEPVLGEIRWGARPVQDQARHRVQGDEADAEGGGCGEGGDEIGHGGASRTGNETLSKRRARKTPSDGLEPPGAELSPR